MKPRSAVLVLLGALLIGAALLYEEEESPDSAPRGAMNLHPENFTLASLRGGDEALKELRELHRGSSALQLQDAVIAEYMTRDGRLVKVWVGVAANRSAAERMVQQMRAKLGASGMFAPAGSLSVADTEVFKARGMGGRHYFYARENRVVWISGMLSDEELRVLVESF
ncbi:MAG: hypothetical protein GXO66_06055 [Euryarchaeota archaeon]|nr:hypothetical protein [Euryarchaeota archaeon]